MDWQKILQSIMQTEETILPMFIHNPQSQKITGAIMVTETVFSAFLAGLSVPSGGVGGIKK